MIKYKNFLSLTDDEIRFILTDIFNPVKIENIKRNKDFNEISAEITTDGWKDGETENFEITDEVILTPSSINVDFSIKYEDVFKWKQFLLAKGCDERLKDNPYLGNLFDNVNISNYNKGKIDEIKE